MLSVLGIALLVNLFLISAAIYTRRRGRSQQTAVAAGPTAALTRTGMGNLRPEGPPITVTAPGTVTAFAVSDRRANGSDAPSGSSSTSTLVPGIDDAVTWTRLTDGEAARIARYSRPATIVLVELDGLDRLVATLGAAAGDRVLAATAATIRSEARTTDTVARLGPHRFGVLLPETDEIAAINYTERVRAICDRWLQTGSVSLRVAIGHASLTPALGAAGAMRLCQERLDKERRPEQHDLGARIGEEASASAPKSEG